MNYKLITFRYDGKPQVIDGNYVQAIEIQIGTIDDKINQWFGYIVKIPMNAQIGTLNDVSEEIQRQAEEYVSVNFNS